MSRLPDRIEYYANNPHEAAEDIALYLRSLLEQQHLYQSVVLRPTRELTGGEITGTVQHVIEATLLPWLAIDPQEAPGRKAVPNPLQDVVAHRLIKFRPPDVKLFCTPCARVEAFNLAFAEEFLSRGEVNRGYKAGEDTVQVFVFSYQCQSCKGAPEVFLVRRQGLRLTNAGRAPIEHVEVPASIPKTISKFFSGAIVAHQSGQTLAGLFLFRTLLEQFARATTGSTATNADTVLEAYMVTLPKGLKDAFPSMRSLYDELSADLHSAAGSTELFESTRQQIVEHFEARRLFKIPVSSPPRTTSTNV